MYTKDVLLFSDQKVLEWTMFGDKFIITRSFTFPTDSTRLKLAIKQGHKGDRGNQVNKSLLI